MSYKTITIPKRGGGTRKQRVQVLKSGKYKFVKNPKKSKSSKKVTKSKKKVKRKVAKKKTKRRYKMTIPLAPLLGFAAPIAHSIPWFRKDIVSGVNDLSASVLGYDFKATRFDYNTMKRGLLPIILGLLIHKFIGGTLGVNRMLGRAKVPLLRL